MLAKSMATETKPKATGLHVMIVIVISLVLTFGMLIYNAPQFTIFVALIAFALVLLWILYNPAIRIP